VLVAAVKLQITLESGERPSLHLLDGNEGEILLSYHLLGSSKLVRYLPPCATILKWQLTEIIPTLMSMMTQHPEAVRNSQNINTL